MNPDASGYGLWVDELTSGKVPMRITQHASHFPSPQPSPSGRGRIPRRLSAEPCAVSARRTSRSGGTTHTDGSVFGKSLRR